MILNNAIFRPGLPAVYISFLDCLLPFLPSRGSTSGGGATLNWAWVPWEYRAVARVFGIHLLLPGKLGPSDKLKHESTEVHLGKPVNLLGEGLPIGMLVPPKHFTVKSSPSMDDDFSIEVVPLQLTPPLPQYLWKPHAFRAGLHTSGWKELLKSQARVPLPSSTPPSLSEYP